MPGRSGGVRTQVALEALLPVVCLVVQLKGVAVREDLGTLFTLYRFVRGVQFLYVYSEICFPTAGRGTQLACKNRLISCTNKCHVFNTHHRRFCL